MTAFKPHSWQLLLIPAPAFLALSLVFCAGLPSPTARLLLLGLVLGLTGVAHLTYHQHVQRRELTTLRGLIDALREGDYTVRGKIPDEQTDYRLALSSLNVLAERLQEEQRRLQETFHLLNKTLASLDGAVFVFDSGGRLRLLNPAAERLVGWLSKDALGVDASTLGLATLFEAPSGSTHVKAFNGQTRRWQVNHAAMHSRSLEGRLLVIQPIERALREEEQQAFARLLRVLAHEINNSLAPIASLGGTLKRLLPAPGIPMDDERHGDLAGGLDVIVSRSAAMKRFIGNYSQLARLPAPKLVNVSIRSLCIRVAQLLGETRVSVTAEDELAVVADPDQLEQVLINLVRNAIEARADAPVDIVLSRRDREGVIEVIDEGPGLPASGNLFVPFFTTKPEGAGIGLVVSRQLVEAQHGTLTLLARLDGSGAVAEVRLPLATDN